MDKNQGYAILKAVMLENGRGFALGEHPTAPSRYVTWACYDDKDGQRQYEWGHYGNDRTAMEQDFTDRVHDRILDHHTYLDNPSSGRHIICKPGIPGVQSGSSV